MASFTGDPLLCETFSLDATTNAFTTVLCPFPTELSRFTAEEWAENTQGILCDSNNDIECAADGNPLTTSVFNTVSQTLDVAVTALNIATQTEELSVCQRTRTIVDSLLSSECGDRNIERRLLVGWIFFTATGVTGAILFVLMLLMHRTTTLSKKTTFTAVYGPGAHPDRSN